ncbi:MAG: MBL fold metallo-hydrolase [Patescibacteria group bacterium]
MEIFWHGNSGISIKGKNANVAFNPKDITGYDLVIFSAEQKEQKLAEGQFVVDGPGEYEVKAVMVYSILNPDDNKHFAWQVMVDDMACFYSDKLDFVPTDEQLDAMGTIDVAFVALPMNKEEEKQMQTLIEKLEPRIIIPIAKDDDTSAQVCVDLSRVLGLKCDAPAKSFKLKNRTQLPEDQQLYIALEKTK